jgi:hypothetical protein
LNKNKLSRPRNTFPLFRAAAMSPLSERPPHHKNVCKRVLPLYKINETINMKVIDEKMTQMNFY